MGEDVGRFYLAQLVDSIMKYMHEQKGAVHRDIKLENVLLDSDLNIKVADFGFAAYQNIKALNSYRGTKTYMAPEIREGKTYNGKKVDTFSIGVVIFIIV